jgi:phosphoglycolate phosphatase-like HAD superfamily hydrolase
VSKESLGRLEKGNTGLSGQFMTDVRAVLFDLDGTLLDTLEDIGRSANETLEELGFPSHPIESYRRSFAALCRRVWTPPPSLIIAWAGSANLTAGAGTWRRGLTQEFPSCWTAS